MLGLTNDKRIHHQQGGFQIASRALSQILPPIVPSFLPVIATMPAANLKAEFAAATPG